MINTINYLYNEINNKSIAYNIINSINEENYYKFIKENNHNIIKLELNKLN